MTLAKGLTGGYLPLGAVVLSAAVARALEPQVLYTGLTYCGHPLSCAAGVAAIESYEQEDLIGRSRLLGAALFEHLVEVQSRWEIIGDVRGGHGLYAVIELVRDRSTRDPLAPWDQVHPALKELLKKGLDAGVSFAARGNLILIAPPLVIEEKELLDALTLLDRLIGEMQAGITQRFTKASIRPASASVRSES
jgi:taurine--2-oxoglutarate transaminase